MMNSLKKETINMITRANKTMRYRIAFISCLFLTQFVSSGFAQHTQVNFDSEIELNLKTVLETKISKLLMDINKYQTEGRDDFSLDSGISDVKQLVNDNDLYSSFDSIRVSLVLDNDTYEASQIYLQKINSNPYQFVELNLSFDKTTLTLKKASIVAPEYSFERVLANEMKVNVAEQDLAKTFLAKFVASIQSKQVDDFKAYFNEKALIISDSLRLVEKKLTVRLKRTVADFASEIKSEMFNSDNEITINYSEAILFRHPELSTVFGFTAKESWITSNYSFDSYIWLSFDLSKESQQILIYVRKSTPFVHTSLKSIIQKPMMMRAGVLAVSSDTSIHYARHGILIKSQSTYPDVLSSSKIVEMLQKDRIHFSDIKLIKDSIRVIQDAVYVQYTIPEELLPAFKIEQTMFVDKGLGIKGLSQKMDVFAGKDTEILIAAETIEDALPSFQNFEDFEDITFKSKPQLVKIVVADKNNFTIAKLTPAKDGETVKLTDGKYSLYAYKEGFYTKKSSFEVIKGQDRMVAVRLSPVESLLSDMVDSPINKPTIKRKWKILGIAAILAGSAYIYMLSNDTSRPKIPNPPGRPIGL